MGDLGKLIVAKGFEYRPKVQLIAQSGHTAFKAHSHSPQKSVDTAVDCIDAEI